MKKEQKTNTESKQKQRKTTVTPLPRETAKRNTDSENPQTHMEIRGHPGSLIKRILQNPWKPKETKRNRVPDLQRPRETQGPWPGLGGVLCQWRHCIENQEKHRVYATEDNSHSQP